MSEEKKEFTFENEEYRQTYWHTCSHIMAQAVKRLWPEVKLAIGPSIKEGWYYDMDAPFAFTPEHMEKIEAEMRKICKEKLKLERFELPREEAVKFMEEKGEPYKVELIQDLPEDAHISFYKQGEFTDLCAGPHLDSTGRVKGNAIKLLACNAAYWRGDSNRETLQRIYGIAFPKKEELDAYLERIEEAKRRDHRKLGRELGLFMTNDLVGKGMPMFLPKGYTVWQILENYIKEKERKLGYQHVMTPCVGTVDLYRTSGHWDHYKENMFPAMEVEDESFVLRPMNCPHHMMIYANRPHSYRQLPVRIGEVAHDFRFEASGTLKGIERARHFCQNDAHLFVTPDQIKSEVAAVCDLIFDVYKDFNITNYRCVLSLRDPADKKKYHDDDEMWNKAEGALREVLTELGIHFTEEIGEAAFYGPKLDVNVQPAVGNEYTLSTCQLDFCLPARFHLKYADKNGEEQTPVVLHRAILGSLDRFMAYLIEETMGAFPAWLAPVQVKVLPITDRALDYANELSAALDARGFRVEVDDRNEKIGKKIRETTLEKVPYMLVVGDRDIENKTVSVRTRGGEDLGAMSLEEFSAKLGEEVRTKAIH
ncbi:MAG: threonine--tRNA ligase [Oscillibacter sp.]|jgi:threonyl-tRNA synthetase|uniref:threonine--tRNA ligase n=1 Tax=uncultured Dysosmobacter sp. TaxID=2591384 RepID=UPI002670E4B5|nr:threonine--tRNA ligase [Dysosmobacter sp.]MDD6409635.1 threonine--tRNA ligase [Oscillibacter sp.]MDY3866193.1 threonine--tRNA ligase [Dysosmobacter sp.]